MMLSLATISAPHPRQKSLTVPLPLTLPLPLRLGICGGVAGMITHGLLHPLDTVKVLRQVYPGAYHGLIPGLRYLLREVGLDGLYRGWGPAILGGGVSSALYFGVYEWVRRQRRGRLLGGAMRKRSEGANRMVWRGRMGKNMIAAACGNLVSSVVFVPKEVLKQRVMIGGGVYKEIMDGLASGGLKGWYVGWGATMGRNLPSNVVRFGIYEEVKWGLKRWREKNGLDCKLGRGEYALAGAVAGGLASAVTTPMDVMKTRFATSKVGVNVGLLAAMKNVVRERGIAGLYVGIRPRVLWAACFAALGFSAYELCKDVFAPGHSTKRNKGLGSQREKDLN